MWGCPLPHCKRSLRKCAVSPDQGLLILRKLEFASSFRFVFLSETIFARHGRKIVSRNLTPLRRMGGFRNTPPARRSVASVAPAFQGGLGAVSQGCLSSKKILTRCLVRVGIFFDPLTAARPPYLARQTEAARRAGVFRAFHTPPAQRE